MALHLLRGTTGLYTSISTTTRRERIRHRYQSSKGRTLTSTSLNSLVLPKHDAPIHTIAAPMVAASDYAFRCLRRNYGTDLTYTQMLHTENLLLQETFRKNHLDLWEYTKRPATWSREQQDFLEGSRSTTSLDDHVGSTTGPVIVQLAGHDPTRVVAAARLIYDHTEGQVHGFDLNLGKSTRMHVVERLSHGVMLND